MILTLLLLRRSLAKSSKGSVLLEYPMIALPALRDKFNALI